LQNSGGTEFSNNPLCKKRPQPLPSAKHFGAD